MPLALPLAVELLGTIVIVHGKNGWRQASDEDDLLPSPTRRMEPVRVPVDACGGGTGVP